MQVQLNKSQKAQKNLQWSPSKKDNGVFIVKLCDPFVSEDVYIPTGIAGKIVELHAYAVGKVYANNCPQLKIINTDATKVKAYDCPNLQTINAPEVKNLEANNCPQLQTINATNLKMLDVDGCPEVTPLQVLTQLDDAKSLHCLWMNGEEIEKDKMAEFYDTMKAVQRDLNGSEYVSTQRGGIVHAMRPFLNVSGNEPSKVIKDLKCSSSIAIIGSFLDPQTIDSMSKLNSKAYEGSFGEDCTGNLLRIKEYKKANIAEKAHAHTFARETINTILNGVYR